MPLPLVSVIIPVYNCQSYLKEAIESVLAQDYRPIEIIVADDGSTDSSGDVAKRFGKLIKYSYASHAGLGATRNRGIDLARGELIAFLDADDRWLAYKLNRQIFILEENPQVDIVFGHVRQFYSPELDATFKKNLPKKIMQGYLASTVLVKRCSFDRVGPFATHWKVGEFIDWYNKAIEAGLKSFMLKHIVVERRIHHTNMGIRERASHSDYARIIKESLERRRKSQSIGNGIEKARL